MIVDRGGAQECVAIDRNQVKHHAGRLPIHRIEYESLRDPHGAG